MRRRDPDATARQLLEAATALFAARGYHGTTSREVAAKAGVNLAACNYHYGSKRDLYVAVLRAQFATTRARLEQRHASVPEAELATRSPAQIEAMLRARIAVMLELLLGPPPSPHGALMHREMADPSEALPIIVGEFIRPMEQESAQLIRRLAPQLTDAQARRCALSLIGQVLFYRTSLPALLQLLGRQALAKSFVSELTTHITTFTLGGIAAVVKTPRRKTRVR